MPSATWLCAYGRGGTFCRPLVLCFTLFPRHYQLCTVVLVEVSSLDEDVDPESRDPSEPPRYPKLRTRVIVSDRLWVA